jgi:hypothetical protein
MIPERINTLAERVKDRITKQWVDQGHSLTGKFEQTITHEVEDNNIIIKGRGYSLFLQYGVRADQIRFPFAKKRIDALTAYAQLRLGLPPDVAKRVAGAIAYKHSKEGMPLPSTVKFSKTGQRTGFITNAKQDIVNFARQEWLKITKDEIYNIIRS